MKFKLENALAHFSVDDATSLLKTRDATRIRNIPLALVKQVHGSEGIQASKIYASLERVQADWIWTQDPDLAIGVFVADCTAALVSGENSNGAFVAAIHAGWRGTAAEIFENFIQTLKPKKFNVWMAPSICQEHYEVGQEVAEALGNSVERFIRTSRPGHYYLDLKGYQIHRLFELGATRVDSSSLCTAHQPEFFSYRQSHGKLNARHLASIHLEDSD